MARLIQSGTWVLVDNTPGAARVAEVYEDDKVVSTWVGYNNRADQLITWVELVGYTLEADAAWRPVDDESGLTRVVAPIVKKVTT